MAYHLKKEKRKKRKNKTIRISPDELQEITNKAKVYCKNGNISEWMRYASLNCIPFRDDLEKENEK